MLVTIKEVRTVKLTRLAKALVDFLDSSDTPLITDYQLFLAVRHLYKNPEGLYLRGTKLTSTNFRRTRNILIDAKKIARDEDYPGAYRILSKQDLPADDVTCLVDPFCYVSHLSAMQRYGLTDRRPEALHLTIPASKIIKEMVQKKMTEDFESEDKLASEEEKYRLNIVHHPQKVRKRTLDIFSTVHYGQHIQVKGSWTRLSTIGQTFLDMLEEPQKCGGMAHVLDIWQEHAKKYLNDIVSVIDNAPKSIHKVRAGYILDEVMGIDRPEITKWTDSAQRGGSRILDPSKPFINTYSEKWMLSINV